MILDLPVTVAEYAAFCAATGRENLAAPGRPTQPVRGVTWDEATAYAEWAGGRLPTEEEIEAASAGLDAADWSAYPLAECPTPGDPRVPTSATGDWGVRGVLWWWTSTAQGSYRVARGGSWHYSARILRVAARAWYEPGFRYDILGFRLVRRVPHVEDDLGDIQTPEARDRIAAAMDALRGRGLVLSPADCRELLPYLETATPQPLQHLARRCRGAIGDDHE